MTRKAMEITLIVCILVGSFIVIPENSNACFSWTVKCDDPSKNVDKGEYVIYEIQTSFSPGCKSTYWVSFSSSGEPPGWNTTILDEFGLVIPYGAETVLSGTVSYLFSLKVTAPPGAMGGETAIITTHIRATDYYNQDETKDVVTTTTVNDPCEAPNPVILSENGTTMNSINLTWTESDEPLASFDRYELHMSLVEGFTPVKGTLIATITDRGTTEYTVNGLSPETTYYFVVRVWDNDPQPEGPYFADSNLLEACTKGINHPPCAVVLNLPEDVTNQEANLSWSKNMDTDFAYYEIHASLTPGFTPSVDTRFGDPITDQSSIKSLITGLTENTTYYFKIRVFDTGGLYNDSNEESCTTLDYIPPSIVLDDPYNTTISSTELKWSQSCESDFDHYEVHMSQTPGFPLGPATLVTTLFNSTEIHTELTELDEKTTYYFCVRVVDKAGNFADSNEVWCTTLDSTLPRIISTSPYNNEINVGILQNIVVTFNKQMDKSSVKYFCFPNPGGWSESWSNGDQTVTYSHNAFESQTSYVFQITSGKDLDGYDLINGEVSNPWSFITEDLISPKITSTQPVNGATDVPITATIFITFSEVMDTSSITFTCSPDPGGWLGSWSNSDQTLMFSHNAFEGQTIYTCQVTAGKDLAGNDLINGDVPNPWSFETEDTILPTIISTVPIEGETDVPVTTVISITFSEEMDHQSVESAIFTTISYETPTWNGNTITLIPTSKLDYSTQYTITIDTEAMDQAGNHLSESFTFQFTTENTNRAPEVSVSSPNNDVADITIDILWTATDQDNDLITISLLFDDDNNFDNGGLTLIESGLSNSGSYTWDTSDLPEGNYYIYVKANDGRIEAGSYSGLLTIEHPEDSGGDGGDGGQGDTNIGDKQEDDSFPWILLWIIICVIVILTIMMAMVYRERRKTTHSGLINCSNCGKRFAPFNPTSSSVQCPYCGESSKTG